MNENIWYAIDHPRVLAGTSTRRGGVSTGPFAQLNLAFHTGDDPAHVRTNRDLFSNMVGVPLTKIIWTYQSHSTILKSVTHQDAGRGANAYEDGIHADALYTRERGLMLAIFHADCVPVFIVHKHQPLIAIIHAGTQGSLQQVTLKNLRQLKQETGIDLKDIDAYLGPSLDFAHHPISQARVDEVLAIDINYRTIIKKIGGQYFLDIPLLNYVHLVDAGLQPHQIHVSNLDTFSNPKDFYSYDRDKQTGRHLSFIYLR
jgi:YfiH family protein